MSRLIASIALLAVAATLTGCAVAPPYGYGYGYAQPYYPDYGYGYGPPYGPVYGSVGIWGGWGGCCYYRGGGWHGRGGWHGGGWHGGGGGYHGGGMVGPMAVVVRGAAAARDGGVEARVLLLCVVPGFSELFGNADKIVSQDRRFHALR